MRSSKPRSDTIGRRGVFLALALAGIFGSSAASSLSAVAENTPADHHKDLIDRYLQAISEQDGSGGAAAPIGDTSEENQSCFAGRDASCQDNPSFLSAMGASCKMHERFDCTMLHAIGYTELEVYAVVTNCPCACDVPCGQWTITPSAAPSSMPSSTPSARPSASPTSQPSDAPPSSPTGFPTSAPTISLPPTLGVKGSSGKIGGILAAFTGVSGVVALAFCAKRGRSSGSWGEPVDSFGSKEGALNAEEYNNGYPFSGAKNRSLVDLEHGDNTEKCPSAIDQLYSASQESTGSFHILMAVEDRIEIVEVPAMQSSNSLGSDGGSFEAQFSKSVSKSFAEGDLEMITEVSVGDSKSVDEDFSTGHEDIHSGYGADDDSAYGQPRAEQPKTYRRRQAPAQRTPPHPNGKRTPGRDNILRSAPRNGRPPLFASPGMQVGRMTMLSTPQSVDSEGSVELVLPHEGSI